VFRAALRQAVRCRPSAIVNGSTVISSAPPEPAAAIRDRRAHTFTEVSRRVIIAPAVLAMTVVRAVDTPAGLLVTRPQFAERAEFAIFRTWSAIGCEAEIVMRRAVIELNAPASAPADKARAAQREGELRRLEPPRLGSPGRPPPRTGRRIRRRRVLHEASKYGQGSSRPERCAGGGVFGQAD